MLAYSALLTLALALSSPWWLLRMATTERYREGLWQRLGAVPWQLVLSIQGKRAVWVHAVSVGEVLAASRLVGELEAAMGDGYRVVISTTTRTGQALARERFGANRVFYMPLDFAFSVRAYLRAQFGERFQAQCLKALHEPCGNSGLRIAVILLSHVSLNHLAIDIMAIGVVAGAEVLVDGEHYRSGRHGDPLE